MTNPTTTPSEIAEELERHFPGGSEIGAKLSADMFSRILTALRPHTTDNSELIERDDPLINKRLAIYDGMKSAIKANKPYPVSQRIDNATADTILSAMLELERRRIALEASAPGWRDIATVPHDGTWVMCWGPDCLHGLAKFGCNPIWAEYPEYTHWQPLPAPPKQGD